MTEEIQTQAQTLTITEATGGESLTDLVLRLTREKNELQAALDGMAVRTADLERINTNLTKDNDGMQAQIASPQFELAKMIDQLISLRLEEFVETDTFRDNVEVIAERLVERQLEDYEPEDEYDNYRFRNAVESVVEDMSVSPDKDDVRDIMRDILSDARIEF